MVEWRWLKEIDLGSGSYGLVYLAQLEHPVLRPSKKFIAVKIPKPRLEHALQKETKTLQSFIGDHEKYIIQCLNRSNLVISNENGNPLQNLMMEYAPYGSLGDLLTKHGPIIEHKARIYTNMLLQGLVRIHGKGIVHCDLKPSNILLFDSSNDGETYHAKIADFGSSIKKDEDQKDGKALNNDFRSTPCYMSPELVKGEIDTPMDIWSLGCTVIEMMTGSREWYKKVSARCEFGILREVPKLPDELSENCKDFLSKCFVINPTKRWSAEMLLTHHFPYYPYDFLKDIAKFPKDLTSLFS